MNLTLRPYQQAMREFASEHPRCALFAQMGLGKTPTTAMHMVDSLEDRCDIERWLVVGPKLVVADTWPNAFKRFSDFRHLAYRNLTAVDLGLRAALDPDTGRRTGMAFVNKRATKGMLLGYREPVHLVSWHMLPWLVRAYGANWPYDGIVCDESIFAANPSSDMHKAVYHVVHRLKAVRRLVLLSGSPMPNGYEQLHGQMRLIEPDLLGASRTAFHERYMTPDKMNRGTGQIYSWKLARGAKAEIDALVARYAVALSTQDYLDLPPLVVNPILVSLPEAARTAYAGLERDFLTRVGGSLVLAPSEAVAASKLIQIASGAVYDETGRWVHVHDAKIERLAELMDSTSGPMLLAYSFQHEWDRIAAMGNKHIAHVHAPGALDRFRKGELKMLCMHPASGGHGLDGLQHVSATAVWFGCTYNADHWAQFNARLHRDGTKADRVVVHQLLAADTLEETVAGVTIPEKITEQELLLHAVRMRQTRATTDVSGAYAKR